MNHSVYPDAVARIRGGREYPQLSGMVRLSQRRDGVLIEVHAAGLPRTETGFFAFHIHQGGSCTGVDFSDSGAHYNPGNAMHPEHAGDLPPLLADQGRAYMKVLTNRFRLRDVIGRTVIIHLNPDDFHTQPSGNAGQKIACGVIRWV